MTRSALALTWLSALCLVDSTHCRADTPQTAGLSQLTIVSTDIGHIKSGSRTIHIFENSRNANNPNNYAKWQFAIEPILTTMPDLTGKPTIYEETIEPLPVRDGKKIIYLARHRVLVPFLLDDAATLQRCLETIKKVYPDSVLPSADKAVSVSNIDVLPITHIKISIDDISSGSLFQKYVKLITPDQYFLSSPNRFVLEFEVTEVDKTNVDQEMKKFLATLPYIPMKFFVEFAAKSAAINLVSFDAKKIEDTSLYKKLNGTGGALYVSRNDLQQLSLQASAELQLSQVIEDKSSFNSDLFTQLIKTAQTEISADEKSFSDKMWAQTYDGDDLKPSVITKQLQKIWTYDSSKNQFTTNVGASGGGSFLGIISANAAGSYSSSGLQEYLKQNSIEAETDGNIVVAKSIDLVQVNFSTFISQANISLETRNIEGAQALTSLNLTVFGQPVNTSTGDDFPYQ